ncbi:unnamed protein product [Fusarium graminearum]|uniref:Chromosome 3, complete genome n=1 Tax=Gibberella zeae (strain ATCC MYA-4620 / CBS 123657 / FGSC 9075 / NRRL 31084 / PH-1) TaxID=229533 RepID=A0A098DYW3_GIBZE|nr:unnamed protein product [Fusarium graminearum]CZS84214.1 unnamed protein product [Fusarium graminearum]
MTPSAIAVSVMVAMLMNMFPGGTRQHKLELDE